jgi:hypothetical protein
VPLEIFLVRDYEYTMCILIWISFVSFVVNAFSFLCFARLCAVQRAQRNPML